jgi:hypothetical protein
VPITEWLALQGRFAHMLSADHGDEVAEIQRRIDDEWDRLVRRSEADAAARAVSAEASAPGASR